jgi:hypothetical protein
MVSAFLPLRLQRSFACLARFVPAGSRNADLSTSHNATEPLTPLYLTVFEWPPILRNFSRLSVASHHSGGGKIISSRQSLDDRHHRLSRCNGLIGFVLGRWVHHSGGGNIISSRQSLDHRHHRLRRCNGLVGFVLGRWVNISKGTTIRTAASKTRYTTKLKRRPACSPLDP